MTVTQQSDAPPVATADPVFYEPRADLGTSDNFMDWDFAKASGIPTLCKNSPAQMDIINGLLLSSDPVAHLTIPQEVISL